MHRFHSHPHHGHRHDRNSEDRRFARGEPGREGPLFGRSRHGGRAGLGRFFAHGDLRLVILHLIAERPRHGYDIIKAIEERVGGTYSPSPGVIYPTLTLLEEQGFVTVAAEEGGRKLHAITEEGRAFLEANRRTLATDPHRRSCAPWKTSSSRSGCAYRAR